MIQTSFNMLSPKLYSLTQRVCTRPCASHSSGKNSSTAMWDITLPMVRRWTESEYDRSNMKHCGAPPVKLF